MKRTSIKKNVVCVIYGITIAATSYAAGSDLSGEMRPEHPGIALSKAINEGKLPVVESVIAMAFV